MAKVLLAWELGAGAGHCANLLPIAKELVELGHEVTFAARQLATARSVFRGIEVDFLLAPPYVESPTYAIPRERSYPQLLHNIGFGDDEDLGRHLKNWRRVFDRVRPELAVFEHAPTALLASRWRDCKRVLVGTGFTTPPDTSPCPPLLSGAHADIKAAAEDERGVLERINRLLRADKLAPLDRVCQLMSEVDESFLLSFCEFDPYVDRGDADFFGCWSPTGNKAPAWPESSGWPVFCYVSPSSLFAYARPLLEALATAGLGVLACVPGRDASLESLSHPNVVVDSEPFDLDRVAQRCTFAVTNGSSGVTAHLLLRGVPMLIVPIHVEQQAVGEAVQRLGAGRLAHSKDPRGVVAAVTGMMTDGSYRAAAERFAARYHDFDAVASARRVVDRVVRLLAN